MKIFQLKPMFMNRKVPSTLGVNNGGSIQCGT